MTSERKEPMRVRKRKTPRRDYLNLTLDHSGLANLPGVIEERDWLFDQLTESQIGSVARLLNHCLLQTHRVGHLPWIQAMHAIRDSWCKTPPPRTEDVP